MRIFFAAIIAVYALLFLVQPHLGPTDDFVFLRTLQVGKPLLYFSSDFPYYDTWALGRFGLLSSLEYNLFWFFSDAPPAFWYFLYHAIQFAIFIYLFLKLLRAISQNKLLNYLIVFLLILLPGFVLAWFRLQLPERNVIFFFTAFLLSYLLYHNERKTTYLALSILLANVAIYYKEISFAAVAAFSCIELFTLWKVHDIKTKLLNVALLASSFIYLGLYYIFVFSRSSLLYLPQGASNSLLSFVKNIANYAFSSDPFLILIVFPLALWRLYKILIKKSPLTPFYDALLAGAVGYAVIPMLLNLYGPYYLIPAYIFAIPAILHFAKGYSPRSLPPFFKVAGALTAFLLVFNTIPSGIHQLTYNKYLPYNFNTTLDFLVQDLRARESKNQKGKPSIFLAGVDRGAGRGTYFILADYLHHRGIEDNEYDMKSAMAAAEPFSPVTKIQPPFTVFKAGPAEEPRQGDYLIVTPQATRDISEEYLLSLRKKYTLVFQTSSPFALPDLNLKTIVKQYLLKKSANGNTIIKDENLLQLPDYYLFIKT